MHRSHVRLVLGVLVAVTSLIVAGAAGGASKKSTAGSMTFGAEQEPPCLNGFTSGCNNTWTSWTAGIALASPLIVKPDFSIKPYMGTAKLLSKKPFTVRTYTTGQSIVMVRNSTFWGKRPTLDKITFLFRTNTDTEIQAIRGGEVDAIYPQPQLQLAQLRGQSGLRVQTHAGTTIEHIDINTGAGNSNPLLGQAWFRQAIAYSMDRQGMAKQLYSSLNLGL